MLSAADSSQGQGCVAARGAGACSRAGHEASGKEATPESGFQASVNYRYFRSDRPFSGDQEQQGKDATKPINDSMFIDFGVTYNFNARFGLTLTIPYSEQTRLLTFSNTIKSPGFSQRYGTLRCRPRCLWPVPPQSSRPGKRSTLALAKPRS